MVMARLTPAGAPAGKPGRGGLTKLPLRFGLELNAAAGKGGTIFVSGVRSKREKQHHFLARIVNGRLDRGFGRNGVADRAMRAVFYESESVIAAGSRGSAYIETVGAGEFRLDRFNSAGDWAGQCPRC